jgi:hypothetical protein
MLENEYARSIRLQRTVNADVASLHDQPVAETVARRLRSLSLLAPVGLSVLLSRHGASLATDMTACPSLGTPIRHLAES